MTSDMTAGGVPRKEDACPTPLSDLEARLQHRADQQATARRHSMLVRIVALRGFMQRERAAGRSWEGLNQLLADEGLLLSTGTLRHYWSLLQQALHELQKRGRMDPTDQDLVQAIRQTWRAGSGSAPKGATGAAQPRAPVALTRPPPLPPSLAPSPAPLRAARDDL